MNVSEFDKIRPYHDEEVNAAVSRMLQHPYFDMAMQYLFSEEEQKKIISKLKMVETSFGFQKVLMYSAISRILEKSSTGFSVEGEALLKSYGPSVFIANHRDILLDSAILQTVLVDLGMETSEITFGSNLMINDFIIDFGKSNRMYTVFRDGSAREMLENSMRLSSYIHHTINEKKRSSWIAQRKGRTKNGLDQTDQAVLKMLSSFDRKNPLEAFKSLNLVPISISYEFEPCDLLKTKELYLSLEKPYKKEKGEDFKSVLSGITNEKGRIHLTIGKSVNEFLSQDESLFNKGNIHQKIAAFIDDEVHRHYQLFSTNYWAADQLRSSTQYTSEYNNETENAMLNRLEKLYELMGTKNDVLRKMFLDIYANPVKQKERLL